MDFVCPLSRSNSSSCDSSSLSDAGNKATPSSSASHHAYDEKGEQLVAFPVLKLEADIKNGEGGGEEEEQEERETLQEASDGLLSSTFSTCNRKHGYPSNCASPQPVAKLTRARTFNGFSSKHGIEESDLMQNGLLFLQGGAASTKCNNNGLSSSCFVLRSSDTVGHMENVRSSFHSHYSPLSFLSTMDGNKSTTIIQRHSFPFQPTLITSLSGTASNNVFSARQWNEFTQQVYVYKYFAVGVNPPPAILSPLIASGSSRRRLGLPQIASSGGGFVFSRGAIDPEPGRCRRTDGKKWRCSRDAVRDQKYCERHMNRGRNRLKTKTNGGDASLVTRSIPALTLDVNPSSKCAVPTGKLTKSTSFGEESGLQFSLATHCRLPLEHINKPMCGEAASIYTLSEIPSSGSMPLSVVKTQTIHNLFNRNAPFTVSAEDTKPLDAEPLVQSMPLPFQCLTGRPDDIINHVELHNCQNMKSPSPWYEDAQCIKGPSGMDLLIRNRSAAKFHVEEELQENGRVSNWVPISWETTSSQTGGPLMEVVRPNGKEGSAGGSYHHDKLGSPTEVLHRVPFLSHSDSSSGASSPRSSALRKDSCLVEFCDVLYSGHSRLQ